MTREFEVSMDCVVTDPEGIERTGHVLMTIDADTGRTTYRLGFYHEAHGKYGVIDLHIERRAALGLDDAA